MSTIDLKLPNDVNYSQPLGVFIDNEYTSASGDQFDIVDPA